MTATILESDSVRSATTRLTSGCSRCRPAATTQPARVICVDDHPIVAEGLRAAFNQDKSLCLIRHITTALDLLEAIATCTPDLILLDIEMPGPDVFEMADRLRHRHPRLRFAFLSSYTRDGYLAAACRCGAWGYFSKSDLPADLIAGLKSILQAPRPQFILGPAVASHLPPAHKPTDSCIPARHHTPAASQHASSHEHRELHVPVEGPGALTGRELEVLHLIGKGLTRLEIASELSRSVKTIDGHQDRIMRKLGASCRSDLLRYAIREGYAEA